MGTVLVKVLITGLGFDRTVERIKRERGRFDAVARNASAGEGWHDFERATLLIKLERTIRVKRSIENTYRVIDSNDGKRIGSSRSNNFLLVARSNEADRAKGHKKA